MEEEEVTKCGFVSLPLLKGVWTRSMKRKEGERDKADP